MPAVRVSRKAPHGGGNPHVRFEEGEGRGPPYSTALPARVRLLTTVSPSPITRPTKSLHQRRPGARESSSPIIPSPLLPNLQSAIRNPQSKKSPPPARALAPFTPIFPPKRPKDRPHAAPRRASEYPSPKPHDKRAILCRKGLDTESMARYIGINSSRPASVARCDARGDRKLGAPNHPTRGARS